MATCKECKGPGASGYYHDLCLKCWHKQPRKCDRCEKMATVGELTNNLCWECVLWIRAEEDRKNWYYRRDPYSDPMDPPKERYPNYWRWVEYWEEKEKEGKEVEAS